MRAAPNDARRPGGGPAHRHQAYHRGAAARRARVRCRRHLSVTGAYCVVVSDAHNTPDGPHAGSPAGSESGSAGGPEIGSVDGPNTASHGPAENDETSLRDRPLMPPDLLEHALAARGFMPPPEGRRLFEEAVRALRDGPGLEVGTWCGKSAVYLGAAARLTGSTVFTLDHHRGSEENQPGWEYHDPTLVDPEAGRIDTLPFFRRTITRAGLEEEIVAIVGRAPTVARYWRTPLALLFIDGGHTDEHVTNDYEGFGPWVAPGGTLIFHDIFEHPDDGGQAPWRCFTRAMASGQWTLAGECGSMRILRRRP